jgi:hypothetical protein
MLKVMTVVGTRPEIIRLSRCIALFDQHTRHVLVHTGQNFDYELNEVRRRPRRSGRSSPRSMPCWPRRSRTRC